MTAHVAFSFAVLTNIIFPLGALSFSFALSFVWSSTSDHIVTTSLLSVINIRPPGQTHGTIDTLLCETWAHEQACLSPWTGSLTCCWRSAGTMQRASGFIWLELKERERGKIPTCRLLTECFSDRIPPPQSSPLQRILHSFMCISLVANTEWLVGFSVTRVYTVRLQLHQFNTLSDVRTIPNKPFKGKTWNLKEKKKRGIPLRTWDGQMWKRCHQH